MQITGVSGGCVTQISIYYPQRSSHSPLNGNNNTSQNLLSFNHNTELPALNLKNTQGYQG